MIDKFAKLIYDYAEHRRVPTIEKDGAVMIEFVKNLPMLDEALLIQKAVSLGYDADRLRSTHFEFSLIINNDVAQAFQHSGTENFGYFLSRVFGRTLELLSVLASQSHDEFKITQSAFSNVFDVKDMHDFINEFNSVYNDLRNRVCIH